MAISRTAALTPESTISDVEETIQNGLEALRDAPLSDRITAALKFLTPTGYRPVAQLEEDGRKKRSTAAASNWNPATGSIVIYFEPSSATSGYQTSSPNTGPRELLGAESPKLNLMTLKAEEAREKFEKDDPTWGDRDPAERNARVLTRMDQLISDVSNQEATPAQIQQCCAALAEAEKAGKAFLALRWFRDEELTKHKFDWATTPESRQIVLTKAIETGAIQTNRIPNPKAPQHPTTTVKLNRESKYAQEVAPRFQPIRAKGGASASEIILRDRGRF